MIGVGARWVWMVCAVVVWLVFCCEECEVVVCEVVVRVLEVHACGEGVGVRVIWVRCLVGFGARAVWLVVGFGHVGLFVVVCVVGVRFVDEFFEEVRRVRECRVVGFEWVVLIDGCAEDVEVFGLVGGVLFEEVYGGEW